MNLKKIGKVLTSKSVGTGPSSYEKSIYRAAVSQTLRNTVAWDSSCLSVPVTVCSSAVCMSVRMEKLLNWKNVHYTSYLRISRKSAENIQVSLKSDENNGNFT